VTRADVDILGVGPGSPWRVHLRMSRREHGDFHLDPHDTGCVPGDLDGRRRALVDLPWSQPDEVHGSTVRVVTGPGEHDLAEADALVTRCDDAVLGIWVGDCAPVALIGDDGTIAAAHAGWRGAAGGVLQTTISAMRELGSVEVRAVLGPCIHPCCYAFGDADLDALIARFGAAVEGTTSAGERALDMRALVAAALAEAGVVDLDDRSECTGCAAHRYFSHRRRGERERQVLAVWRTS
jgi:YfiH family protein